MSDNAPKCDELITAAKVTGFSETGRKKAGDMPLQEAPMTAKGTDEF